MSQQEQNQQNTLNQQKQTKTKEQIEKEKANTSAWQKKQEEKKKKKLEEQEHKPVELNQKALEKAKRKQQKRLERQQMLKEQQSAQRTQTKPQQAKTEPTTTKADTTQVKVESKKDQKKNEEKVPAPKIAEQVPKKQTKKGPESTKQQQTLNQAARKLSKDQISIQPPIPIPAYTQLLTLEQHLKKSFPCVSSLNKPAQSKLIHKYLNQYVNTNDTILVLSKADAWQPSAQRCTKRVFLYPNHIEFSKNQTCQNIICTYEDIAYLMQGTITKIFVELDMVFANGTGLTDKGNENIVCLANEYKIPVIGFSGTWNFNAWNFLSVQMFVNKYGQSQLEKYDIIENQQLEIVVLEIGSVIPKQISGHLENLSKIYRGCDFNSIKW